MPIIGQIMGTCTTITIKDTDYAHFLSIYYSNGQGPITGLKVLTLQGDILTLGSTENTL